MSGCAASRLAAVADDEDFADQVDLALFLALRAAAARRSPRRPAFFDFGRHARRSPGEDVGERAVVGLGPAVERVLVALGTFQADAQERGGRLLAPLLDGTCLLPPPEQIERLRARHRGVSKPFATASSIALTCLIHSSAVLPSRLVAVRMPRDDLVVGHVLGHAFAEPVVPLWLRLAFCCCGFSSESVLLPVMSQNLVAHRAACIGWASSSSIFFVRLSGRLSARKARTSSGVGRRADGVDGDAAEEFGVARQVRRHHVQPAELGEHFAIDVVDLRHVRILEPGRQLAGHQDADGQDVAAVGDDRSPCRPACASLDLAERAHLGDGVVVGAEVAEAA